ncbi:hypothetical protein JDV02_008096 [Purpureocillium takamizusanense]|uniref:Amino acid permease/ SLC12A domain-containing protein n=1 Tax=Purpureocillium takamizusanense TaxID=2060973 RepID=A0A9Q8QM70_9HYPO|nr:uncharacterized protein JDV02_008096 [Purpureocillium takamizusanense]UNI22185.1 hypothetical protein JDV02_008096 [Purpureocillium takamizusanense]
MAGPKGPDRTDGIQPNAIRDDVDESTEKFASLEDTSGHMLHKQLETRHMTMIALGGALGTGLLIGTGSALATSGPAGVLIDYIIVGWVVFIIMTALGEMVSYMPLTQGFGGYATRFVDPALGFATGYTYCFKYMIGTASQLSAFALVMKYWVGDSVNPAVFISIALVGIIIINSVNVRTFGEVEFWLSLFKVLTMVGIILLLFILAVGGGPSGDRPGFRYWRDPGPFAEFKVKGDAGRFLGIWSALVTAVYAFTGTELVAVTAGESKNPRLSMPKAARLSFYRVFFFYVLSVFFLGMVVPYNSEALAFATHASKSAAASPFVVAIRLAGIKGLDHVINGCIVLFVLSAANSDFYIASRGLYGIAADGKGPTIFAPSGAKVFGYLTSCVTVFGLLVWMSILLCHIAFRRAQSIQGVDPAYVAYRAPFGTVGSYIALGFLSVLIITKGAEIFVGDNFDYKTFILGYIGIPVYLALYLGYKFSMRSSYVRAAEADLVTGVPTITVAEEKAIYEACRKEREEAKPRVYWVRKFYKFLAWLF